MITPSATAAIASILLLLLNLKTNLVDEVALAFSGSKFSVTEDGTPIAAVTVTRTGRSSGVVGAAIAPTDGTATSPADYNNAPITVVLG